jgi:hypothetical protein
MATTTNYSWTTPDDTDLVKDGAAAIRTLGSSIDTTTKALNPSTTLGDIEYRSSTANTNTRLALGTAGQVLKVNSGATAPEWGNVAGGLTLISEQSASANSSLSFTSIPADYKQLLLVWSGIYHSGNNSYFSVRFNNDSTADGYQGTFFYRRGSTVSTPPFSDSTIRRDTGAGMSALFGLGTNNSTSDLSVQANGRLLIDNYTSTTKYKAFFADFGYNYNGVDQNSAEVQGVFKSTSAITSVDIVRFQSTDTFTNSTNTSIRLYGLS